MEGALNDPGFNALVNNFVYSVQVELNPMSSQADRSAAHNFCEKFRTEEHPNKISLVGVALTCRDDVQIVFTGLRILNDVIKYHWADLDTRDLVKKRLMFSLENGFAMLPMQPAFLTEAVARAIVEIAKREWPQLWPDLVPFLLQLQSFSSFLVLRRLLEDIAMCQNEDPFPRKRELLQSFIALAKSLVPSVFQFVQQTVESYAANPSEETKATCKVLLGILLPVLELAPFDLVEEENRLSVLFQLLRHPHFRDNTAECLVAVVSRKGEKKEKGRIYSEFMRQANYVAIADSLRGCQNDDSHFLKQICDIWAFIGSNCSNSSMDLKMFLGVAEQLAARTETFAVVGAANSTNALLRHVTGLTDNIPEAELLQGLTNILNCILKRLVIPSREEKDEMSRLKAELLMLIRPMSKLWPKLYFFVSPWIIDALNNSDRMEVFQWETLCSVIDNVTATVSHEEEEVLQLGLHHLELCFQKFVAEKNVKLKSAILSSVSGLFVFLTLARRRNAFTPQLQVMLITIVKSILQCLSDLQADRDLRRHAGALLIKLSKDNTELLLELFPVLHNEATANRAKLSSMEYGNLLETLLILSNSWEDRSQQLRLIESFLHGAEWQEIAAIVQSPTEFSVLFTPDVFAEKRTLFLKNLQTLVAILGRASPPSSTTNNVSESDYIQSLFDIIKPYLPVVLGTVKIIHSLILDPNTSVLLDMGQSEKYVALGVNDCQYNENEPEKPVDKPMKDKLQTFLRSVEEATYSILGCCGIKFGPVFYSIPAIADAYLSYVGSTTQHMQNFQIRKILKSVFRPFLLSCRAEFVPSVTIPFMQIFGLFMMGKLVTSWEKVKYNEFDETNGPSEEAEIIENSTLRQLTREYFDIVGKLLESSSTDTLQVDLNKTIHGIPGMDMEEENGANGVIKGRTYATTNDLGDVGKMILDDNVCFQSIVHLSANALCWKYSFANLKASRCLLMAMKHVSEHMEVVHAVLTMALRSMVMFPDQQEVNFDGLFRIVDAIFCEFKNDRSVLQALKDWGVKEEDIGRLKNLTENQVTANLKKRKEIFRSTLRHHPAVVDTRGPKSQWLTNLPKLFICDGSKVAKQEAAAREVDLKECFSLIHI